MPTSATSATSRPDRGRAIAVLLALAVLAVCAATLAGAPAAHASDDEVRVDGSCGEGAESSLRLRADDGLIRVRFRVESDRRRAGWQVAIVREGRLAWRGRVRSDGDGSVDFALRLRDLRGADQVTARAVGPGGITCIATGTLRA